MKDKFYDEEVTRRRIVERACASAELEGVEISETMNELCRHFIFGDLSLRKFVEHVVNSDEEAGVKAVARVIELKSNSVDGNFDVRHLKEIHAHIFQDSSAYSPGEFRDEVDADSDWCKNRFLEDEHSAIYVAYSPMDAEAINSLEEILKDAKPEKFRGMIKEKFIKAIGSFYTSLDYIHPFYEGNSRTLREFTGQLAEESGFDIDWSHFRKIPDGRSELYLARDIGVNRMAFPDIRNELLKYHIGVFLSKMDVMEENGYMAYVMKDIVSLL